MFNVNDYVSYRRNICKIREIKRSDFNNKDYYVLVPIDDDSLVINVPAENRLGWIRKVINKEEVERLINNISNIEVIKIDNEKMIEVEYKKLLDSGLHEDLIRIIKTSYLRNKERVDSKKKISEKDDIYFRMAEKMLYNEFSIALKMTYDDTKKYVIYKVNENIGN